MLIPPSVVRVAPPRVARSRPVGEYCHGPPTFRAPRATRGGTTSGPSQLRHRPDRRPVTYASDTNWGGRWRRRQEREPVGGVGDRSRGLGGGVLAVEGEDLLPAVVGGLGAVGRAVDREERVAGAVVAVELVGLAVGLQGLLELVDLGRRRVLVVVAEQAEQRAGQGRGLVDDRDHRGPLARLAGDERAVAVHRGVEVEADRG